MEHFDLIIIGGGATGAGVALDASLRGLKVALLERNDFAEGTSSRSTKLVHGGVRYLEAAVKHLDKAQFDLVREGLRERKIFLHNAPHLAHPLELITPLYHWLELPYIYAGLTLYDLLAGSASLGRSRLLLAAQALRRNPDIAPDNLKGAVTYYDGAFRDSRMVIALLRSAQELGAKVCNHQEVIGLVKEKGRIVGARWRERIDGGEGVWRADLVINATGPYADTLRRMDDPSLEPLMIPSRGVHIVLPKRFLPGQDGLLIPKTRDGRVLFALPYLGHCLAGTTDEAGEIEEHPRPKEEEIDYLIDHLNGYFAMKVRKEDILASFAGLRPLVRKPGARSTAELVREYVTEVSPGGMLTIAGGKWTAYRAMAEKTVDEALAILKKAPRPCTTYDYKVLGSRRDKTAILAEIAGEVDSDVARHLYDHYGDEAAKIVDEAKRSDRLKRLHPDFPVIEAELFYTMEHEYVRKPLDFLVRRCSLGLLEQEAARRVLPHVTALMADHLGWDDEMRQKMQREAHALL